MRGFTHCWWISDLQSANMELVNRCKIKRLLDHKEHVCMQLTLRNVHLSCFQYLQLASCISARGGSLWLGGSDFEMLCWTLCLSQCKVNLLTSLIKRTLSYLLQAINQSGVADPWNSAPKARAFLRVWSLQHTQLICINGMCVIKKIRNVSNLTYTKVKWRCIVLVMDVHVISDSRVKRSLQTLQ